MSKFVKLVKADDMSGIEPEDARKENSQKLKDALAELKITLESLDTNSFYWKKEEELASLIEQALGDITSYNNQLKEVIKQRFTSIF